MDDMPNWHAFVESVLNGQHMTDKSNIEDEAEMDNLCENLINTKKG